MEKTCKVCGRTLPLENFSDNRSAKDGKMYASKECWAEIRTQGAKTRKKKEEPLHKEVLNTIEQSNESLDKTILESKEQDEKIHQFTLKALELFDDESIIQALRNRGYVGDIYKKVTL